MAKENLAHDPLIEIYLREIGELPLLTEEEEKELAVRAKEGDEEAREVLIKSNLRLVVKIAKEYSTYGLSLPDLIAEGNIGLIKAAEKYDVSRGCRFSTYSALWVRQCIRRALSNTSKMIRLPIHVFEKLSKLRKEKSRLTDKLGRPPTSEELAKELDCSVKDIDNLEGIVNTTTSLDAVVSEEDDRTNLDIIPDENMPTPYEEVAEKQVFDIMEELLASLPEREQEIIRGRFGLYGNEEETLNNLGEKQGLTRERIRQLEQTALKRLRKLIAKKYRMKKED